MKRIHLLAFVFLTFFLSNCGDDEATPSNIMTISATMSGANSTPANASTATGTVTGTYDKTTKILSINVTYSGIAPNSGHIHKGAVGVAGGVVFAFTSLTSPIAYVSVALTADQVTDLLAGSYYVNLHTVAFPAGEIRGQLKAM